MAVNIDFRVKNGLAVATTATIEGTTSAISTTTGALTVRGGVGIGGNLYVGGGTNIGGITTSTNTTAAISTATGALQVYGGVGIGGSLYTGDDIYSKGNLVVTTANLGSFGVSSINTGSGISVNTSTGAVTITSIDTFQTVTSRGNTTNLPIIINNTLTSTSSFSSNALYVAGGIGGNNGFNINGNGYLNGNLIINGSVTATNVSLNLLIANSGTFYGDVTGSGALYAGVLGYTPFAQTMAQFTGNLNDYMEINVQNINAGYQASTDIVASADNVSETGAFVDLGITSSGWDGSAGLTFGNALGPNDGYLLVGNSNLPGAGNLSLGTLATNTNVKIIVAGTNSNYITAIFNNANTQSISTNTGAFTVRGGVGISGNIYVGNSATIASTMASTTTVASNALYVAGGVGIAGSLYVTGPAVFQDNVIFNGTSTFVLSTNTVYTDNIIELHYPNTPGNTWTVNDTKDIGLRFHYYDTEDRNAFLGRDNATGYLEWVSTGVEDTTSTIAGTFGTFKTGSIILANTTASNSTSTGALTVAGGVGIGGNLYIGGTIFGVANVTGVITTATNVAGGTAGQLHYQTGPGATSFAGPGNSGQLLMSSGTSAPLYVNTASVVIGNAANIAAGTAGQLHYQSTTGTTSFVSIGSVGQLLMSSGTSAPLYVNTASVVIGNAANIAGGTAGQLHYQSSTGTTAFVSTGSVGQILMSSGTSAPLYVNTSSIVIGNAANIAGGTAGQIHYQSSTGTTAFVSTGTVGNVLVSNGTAAPSYNNTLTLAGTTAASSTNTGALQVVGGVGVGGNLYVGGTVYAGSISGVSTTATNIAGGTAGSIPIQSAPGATTFINTGSVGNILQQQAGNTATFVSTSTLQVGYSIYANTATNVAGGTAGQLHYQSGVGATSFVSIGTAGNVLVSNGSSAPTYNNTLTLAGTANATSTTTGALQVVGGVGIGGNTWIGGSALVSGGNIDLRNSTTASIVMASLAQQGNTTVFEFGRTDVANTPAIDFHSSGGNIDFDARIISNGGNTSTVGQARLDLIANQVYLTSTQPATTTQTGALRVVGGVGIGGDLYVGGTIFGVFSGSVTGTATTATNIGAGYAGLIPIQSSIGTTAFINTGSVGNILQQRVGNTATFVSTATLQVGYSIYANTATNVAGGTAGQLHYQSGVGATSFVSTGTAGNVLVSNGTGAPTYNNTLTLTGTAISLSTTTGALQVAGGIGVGDSIYVENRVGFVNTSNVSVVYQFYNAATNSLDTVFG